MRRIGILLIIFLVSCTNINFDGGEYGKYVQIQIESEKAMQSCGTPEATQKISYLTEEIHYQKIYAESRISRSLINLSSKHLEEMIVELNKKKNPSKAYCEQKLKNIQEATEIMIKVLGAM